MPEIPCAACARRAANPEAPWWRDLLAEFDFGHDPIAHRIYFSLIQRGITARRLASMTDAELTAPPNFGAGMLARVRCLVAAPVSGCLFCDILAGREPAVFVAQWPDAAAIVPLDPVVDGHVLVLPKQHVPHALASAEATGTVMRRAAQLGATYGSDLNIIASVGEAATQSVRHLHVHLIPRAEGDGLPLPWTPQQARKAADDA